MSVIKSSPLRIAKEYLVITIGVLLYVVGWSVFLLPNNLVGGGVTGISSIIQYATHGSIKMGTTYFVLNIGLLIAAFLTLSRNFGGKTIYAIIIASVGFNVLPGFIPTEIVNTLAIDNGKLMSTIMGGIIVGVGVGMTISEGGSSGGTDIIALIVNKYRDVSPGRMLLAMDVVIILSSFFIPSYTADGALMQIPEKITTIVYGFILVTVSSTCIDFYVSGSKQSVQLFILSPKYKEIADAITMELHRGVTVLNGKGWYTKNEVEVLMVITRKTDLNVLLRYIKNIDSNAFLSVSSVTGVYGKGFDAIKSKTKKPKK